MIKRLEDLKNILIGKARDINEPGLFHKISLVAFFAWIGLGADGLSSSCYGPEEAFRALGTHTYLGVFIAIATAITVFVIATSYSQIVELFPSGGGGYIVASKLLSPAVGMFSGCALVIDYVLTISISVASGADALFSFLPEFLHPLKLYFATMVIFILIMLNLRGVKESIVPLIPIFLTFLVTHVIIIIYAIVSHMGQLSTLVSATATEVRNTRLELGWFGMLFLLVRAYSMGAGTYTGIEAISNGIPILAEPKVETAKRAMRYMAVSLAFTAGGLMLGYILFHAVAQPGKTMNAVLVENITLGWHQPFGYVFLLLTLVSEAVLLFVAAQTGFLGGPRVVANMAVDKWFPFQFALLSERFVVKNGILLMGGASLAVILFSRGSVKLMVVLYSINVFITFFLSQLGMVKHWWQERRKVNKWVSKIMVNGFGLIMTSVILVSVVCVKFHEGGWLTVLITASLAGLATVIKRYYSRTHKLLSRLDQLANVTEVVNSQEQAKLSKEEIFNPAYDPQAKTAVILVNGFNGMGLHTLFNVVRLFGSQFKNYLFIQAGIIDTAHFKGVSELESLKAHVNEELSHYVVLMRTQGYFSEGFGSVGTDVAEEIYGVANKIYDQYPKGIFFGGQIVFREETILTNMLYNHAIFAVQRRLHQQGIPFIIMPTKVDEQ
jgi:amino acid transporter